MKRRLWLVPLPLILIWTLAFVVAERGDDGTLGSRALLTAVYPTLRRMEGAYTDFKFRLRGPRPTQQKIVIVEIDDRAVATLGRFPWHRDAIAGLVLQAVDAGAKVVGLDIIFPEDDVRVPDGVAELLKAHQLGDEIPKFETDLALLRIIDLNRDKLVLAWMTDGWCRPAFSSAGDCPVTDPEKLANLPRGFEKFGYSSFTKQPGFAPAASPLMATPDIAANIPQYLASALHSGFLSNAVPESDDVIRRTQLFMLAGGHAYPSLPMEMARVGLKEDLELVLDGRGLVERVGFKRSGRRVPVSPTGTMSINFRGAGYHFPYVGAIDLLGDDEVIPVQHDGKIERVSRKEIFKDAYVLLGVTAVGARDLRHFPFDTNIPGTEGLATALDNLLTGDPIVRASGVLDWRLVLLLMTVGALLFGLAILRLEALATMALAVGVGGALLLFDIYCFAHYDVNLNTICLHAELGSIVVAMVAIKYLLEEQGKKFIRGTFSKYLAPAVVDEMLKNPDKLHLSGENRCLTIMMSDLRGFTAMAQRLKPEQVLGVLNHYLGTMADIIVDHNGTIDEFIGDAVLVIFGAPVSHPDDARRAVACAIAMQRAMKGINARNAALGLPAIEMGIALNTGEVIVGNIGSQRHIKYGVVGSHVNLTARIESNTVGGQVLIAGTTLELAGPDIKIGEKQLIVAKGFPDPIPAFEIKGIGGEYNLFLEEVDLALQPLELAVSVQYQVMKSKNEEGEKQSGRLVSLSELGGVIEAAGPLEAYKNLKMRVLDAAGAEIDGDLYAKVIEGGTSCKLRFTAVPPPVAAFIKQRLEPQRKSEVAVSGA